MTTINAVVANMLRSKADRIYWHVMMTFNMLVTILLTCAH